jgi:hypothetical protein
MTILVSDTSVLIDLERGELIASAFKLSATFAVPDVLYERELRDYGGEELVKLGLKVESLDGDGVELAMRHMQAQGHLTVPDSFALALATRRCSRFFKRHIRLGTWGAQSRQGFAVGLYSPERSLVDMIRLRHREGSDIAWEALRRWLGRKGAKPAALIEMAKSLHGAESAVRNALEIVL